jgi:hypothetical protein
MHFIRGGINVHCAMRIFYLNQLFPITEPLDISEAHENLKAIYPSDDLMDKYDLILDNFPIITISDTLKEIRALSN